MNPENLALARTTRPLGLVDRDSFGHFLLGNRTFHSPDQKFSSRLYLPEFRAGIDELYQTQVMGHSYSSDIKEMMRRNYGEELIQDVDLGEPEAVERGRLFFFNTRTRDLDLTSVVIGDQRSVKSTRGLPQVLKDGHTPLFPVHTHPNDSLFSPPDYLALISDRGDGRPIFNAEMLLMPNSQVLALRTYRTPLYPYEEAEKLVQNDAAKDIHDENPKLRELLEAHKKALRLGKRRPHKFIALCVERTRKIVEDMESSGKPEDETIAFVEEKTRQVQQVVAERYTEPLARKQRDTTSSYANYVSQQVNAESLELSRRMEVQLYFSEDRETFFKFSA